MLKIRDAREEDLPRLGQLVENYKFRREPPRPGELDRLKTVLRESLEQPRTRLLVADDTDRGVMGYLCLHILPFPLLRGREAYVTDLLVDYPERNTGAGTALLDTAVGLARREGCLRLMLNNFREAESYRRGFYARRGWRERTEFANFIRILDGPDRP